MSWLPWLVKASYFVAATLFLLGLQRMASPKTARSGIRWAGAGMVLAPVDPVAEVAGRGRAGGQQADHQRNAKPCLHRGLPVAQADPAVGRTCRPRAG